MIDVKARQRLMQQQFLRQQSQGIANAIKETLPDVIKMPEMPEFPEIEIPDNAPWYEKMVEKLDRLVAKQEEPVEKPEPIVIPDNAKWYRKIVEKLDALLARETEPEMESEPKEVIIKNLPKPQSQQEVVQGLSEIQRHLIGLQNAIQTMPTGSSSNREDRKLLKGILDELKGMKNGLESLPQPVMPSNDEMVEKLESVNDTLKALAELQANQANYVPPTVTNVSINALNGNFVTQAITITGTRTAIPTNALMNRRTLIFYNNSEQTVELGGSTLTFGQGLPILPGTYSPPLDAGARLPIYAIVASGTADVRVGEISDQATGR